MSTPDTYISKLRNVVSLRVLTALGQKKKERWTMNYLRKSSTNLPYMDLGPFPYISSVSPYCGGESVRASYILRKNIEAMSSFLQQMVFCLMIGRTDYLNAELTKLYGPTGDLEGMHLHLRPSTPSERLQHYASLKKRCRILTGKKRHTSTGRKK